MRTWLARKRDARRQSIASPVIERARCDLFDCSIVRTGMNQVRGVGLVAPCLVLGADWCKTGVQTGVPGSTFRRVALESGHVLVFIVVGEAGAFAEW